MGRLAETCGAVTGACMVLGLKVGCRQSERRRKPFTQKSGSLRSGSRRVTARSYAATAGMRSEHARGFRPGPGEEAVFQGLPPYVETAAKILEEVLQ